MENKELFEGKTVEINNKINYYIVKQTIYNNNIYLFGNELIDEDTPSDDYAILRVENKPDGIFVQYENDEKIQQELLQIFSNLLEEDIEN